MRIDLALKPLAEEHRTAVGNAQGQLTPRPRFSLPASYLPARVPACLLRVHPGIRFLVEQFPGTGE